MILDTWNCVGSLGGRAAPRRIEDRGSALRYVPCREGRCLAHPRYAARDFSAGFIVCMS